MTALHRECVVDEKVTSSKLAVDGDLEQGPIAQSSLSVEPEAYGANLLRFSERFAPGVPTRVPMPTFYKARVMN